MTKKSRPKVSRKRGNPVQNAVDQAAQKARQQNFLAKYLETGRNDLSIDHADINPATFYRWRNTDPEFEAAYTEARKNVIAILEDAAHKRATKGVKRAVYWKGELIGFERHFSDTLLMFLMKAADGARYGDKVSNTHSGEPGAPPIKHDVTHRGLSAEKVRDLKAKILGVKK